MTTPWAGKNSTCSPYIMKNHFSILLHVWRLHLFFILLTGPGPQSVQCSNITGILFFIPCHLNIIFLTKNWSLQLIVFPGNVFNQSFSFRCQHGNFFLHVKRIKSFIFLAIFSMLHISIYLTTVSTLYWRGGMLCSVTLLFFLITHNFKLTHGYILQ